MLKIFIFVILAVFSTTVDMFPHHNPHRRSQRQQKQQQIGLHFLVDTSRGVKTVRLKSLPNKFAELYNSTYWKHEKNVHVQVMTCANDKVDVIIEQQRANPVLFRQHFEDKLKQSDIGSNNGIETGLRVLLSYVEDNNSGRGRDDDTYNEFSVIMLGPSVQHQTTQNDENMIKLIGKIAQTCHVYIVDMQTSSSTHGILQEAFKSSGKVKFFKWKNWEQNVGKEINSSL